jgi:translation initiation factor IF-3
MDYGKFKYQQKRKAAEAKKNQTHFEVKEVKFRPKTDKHDFDVKVNRLRRFIGDGNKSKVTIMFRGREIVHPEIGQDILRRVAEAISDLAVVEMQPRMEGRQMFMMVAPQKGKGKQAPKTKPADAPADAPAAAASEPAKKDGPVIVRQGTAPGSS